MVVPGSSWYQHLFFNVNCDISGGVVESGLRFAKVFANKQDLMSASPATEIASVLNLEPWQRGPGSRMCGREPLGMPLSNDDNWKQLNWGSG